MPKMAILNRLSREDGRKCHETSLLAAMHGFHRLDFMRVLPYSPIRKDFGGRPNSICLRHSYGVSETGTDLLIVVASV